MKRIHIGFSEAVTDSVHPQCGCQNVGSWRCEMYDRNVYNKELCDSANTDQTDQFHLAL